MRQAPGINLQSYNRFCALCVFVSSPGRSTETPGIMGNIFILCFHTAHPPFVASHKELVGATVSRCWVPEMVAGNLWGTVRTRGIPFEVKQSCRRLICHHDVFFPTWAQALMKTAQTREVEDSVAPSARVHALDAGQVSGARGFWMLVFGRKCQGSFGFVPVLLLFG